ncbi:hypothetical protein RCO28_13935 [Streptomyces sp. LHD-70]|uniref:hypothetical protein n=1 Tax=Streptomyces sp. LHD-70 TaxID=3072140 RepID=UPI00280EEC55|nr:hypothetical protein [Streptomyces sp. LHD-70]MDQ8703578.1 hypothetical protein [Streptomyces sp. LHD-70]
MAEISDELIRLERFAEEERAKLAGLSGEAYEAQRERWRRASADVQSAIARHAEATGRSREAVEGDVLKEARRADEDPAE